MRPCGRDGTVRLAILVPVLALGVKAGAKRKAESGEEKGVKSDSKATWNAK